MAKLVLLLNFLLMLQILSAQDETKKFKFPINEYSVSLNRSALRDIYYYKYVDDVEGEGYVQNRMGLGLGFYRSGSTAKRLNLVAGLEFNHTSQYRKYNAESGSQYMLNTTYTLNNLSLPVGLRLNPGRNTRFFLESGFFVDCLLSSRKKGIYQKETSPLTSSNEYVDKVANLEKINIGFYGGIGTTIPIGKINFLIKASYKFGMINLNARTKNPYYQNSNPLYNRYLSLSIGVKF